MKKEEILKGLESLIQDRKIFVEADNLDCIFRYDVEVLRNAVEIIKTAPEVPVQEQSNITYDFGILEPSTFYVTTDKSFYEGAKENPKFTPMLTTQDFKESLHISLDSQLYVFRIPKEEQVQKI